MNLVLLLIAAATAFAAGPKILYTKSFPGSNPAFVSIAIEKDGAVAYKESRDDDPETFKIEPDATAAIFDLAEKLGHFKNPLESGLKVANMGEKTYTWEDGVDKSETKYNYSLDENARLLQDWFERISESERLVITLRRAIRYDKLGVNDSVVKINVALDKKRLVGREQLLPLLDRVAQNETFLNMARERARQLAEILRQPAKPVAP